MLRCSVCDSTLHITGMGCHSCGMNIDGDFHFPALLRLSSKNMALAEALVLAGGNLKELAQKLDVSYPTVRKRIDDMMQELQTLKQQDQQKINEILKGMEDGTIPPAKGTRMIREINGDL